jgi:multidrug efflux pump subunit AcrA (membrane-fusion protein)
MTKHDDHQAIPLRGHLPALLIAGSSYRVRMAARLCAAAFVLVILGIWFLPWQQFVQGTGKVIAFDPLERRVNVEAPVAGLVRRMHVVEGQRVKSGEVIAELQDNDPNLLANLKAQRASLADRRAATARRIQDLDLQVRQLELARGQSVDAARQRVVAEKIAAETAALNFTRTKELKEGGLVSVRDYELAIQSRDSTASSLLAAEATLGRTESEFSATIAGVRAQRGSAQSDLASVERDEGVLDVQISQNQRQLVRAPRDGIVLSVQATDGTYLRPGSPICVVIPETDSRFVEIWLEGNDMPLLQSRVTKPDGTVIPGSPVRLQFEGWPAIQFVGWPSIAIGTFGGEVVFVDAAGDPSGKFRVVIAPAVDTVVIDGKKTESPWPGNRWLRQGVRANGWVLLQQVPLWKEIWRQLNGFPPVVDMGASGKEGGKK